jgi:hypothetical protein
LTVNVELLPAVTEGGLSDAVAPLGTPETLSATVPAVPAVTAVEIVLVLAVVCRMVRLDGEALRLKSVEAAAIVSATDVVCVPLAAVPVTVRV